jgi:hypothetical protein
MTPERMCKVNFGAQFKPRNGVWRWRIRAQTVEHRGRSVVSEYAYASERVAALELISYLNERAKLALEELNMGGIEK